MRKDSNKHKKCIEDIGVLVGKIIKEVSSTYYLENSKVCFKVLPTPFEIAENLGIRIEYMKMDKGILACFRRKKPLTIYVSDKYENDKYTAQKIVAHELGHYFLDTDILSTMNDFESKKQTKKEIIKEYKANVFAIFLMPQIMEDEDWETWSPELLNNRVYRKIFNE